MRVTMSNFQIEHFEIRPIPLVQGQSAPEGGRASISVESRVRTVDPFGRPVWIAISDILGRMSADPVVDQIDPTCPILCVE